MRKFITAVAIGSALAAPLAAQAATSDQEVAELKAQVQALLARVQQLEAGASQAAGAPALDPARMEQLETRVADIGESNDRQTDALAQAATRSKGMDWATKVRLKGDFRVREEIIQEETRADRNRQRIRARLGLEARVADSLSAGFQIATGSGDDPRSTNATLTDSNARKDIQLDLAYLAWQPVADTTLIVGKQKHPWHRASGSLFYDGDVNPEGVAVRWGGKHGPFVNAWGLVLAERSAAADANIVGAQLGWVSGTGLTVAAGFNDYSGIEARSLSFADYPAGNTTYGSNASCDPLVAGTTRCYLNDYRVVEVSAEYGFRLGRFPATVWADYLENTAADDLNRGYNLGFQVGDASDPGTWEFGALYQDVEADAQWGGFIDSDFAGGLTQGKGVQLKAAYVPIKNTSLNLAYFDTTKSYDTIGERDYQRLQLDFSLKF